MTKDEAVKAFEENWEHATSVSENLKWAIFPVGDVTIETQAAKTLLGMFPNLPGLLYVREDTDPELVIKWANAIIEQYKEKLEVKLASAAEESGYSLHLGV